MQLNEWQMAVPRNYGDGDYAQFAVAGAISDVDLDQCGDTLFVFLMLELSNAEDCDSVEEAIRRIESAGRQLDAAIGALEILPPPLPDFRSSQPTPQARHCRAFRVSRRSS